MTAGSGEALRQQLQGQGGMGSATVTYIWPILEAALAAARADGRNDAARDIEAHRAKWAPMDGNVAQRRLSRHLGVAARVAQGPIDIDDVRAAFTAAVRGSVPAPKGDQ